MAADVSRWWRLRLDDRDHHRRRCHGQQANVVTTDVDASNGVIRHRRVIVRRRWTSPRCSAEPALGRQKDPSDS
jgi:hypothetical protein